MGGAATGMSLQGVGFIVRGCRKRVTDQNQLAVNDLLLYEAA